MLTDPGVTGAVIGPRRPEQLVQAVAAVDVDLTDADRADLAACISG